MSTHTGAPALHAMTGMLLWPFGPSSCEIGEECWTGVLSCGTPTIKATVYTPQINATYNGWSLGSMHIQIVIQSTLGEVVVPDMQLSGSPMPHSTDFIIGRFVLTTTGTFHVNMLLQGWFPSRLFTPRAHPVSEQQWLKHFQQLSPLEIRCTPGARCSVDWYQQECEALANVAETPKVLTSVDNGRCPDRWAKSTGSKNILQQCQGGNNDGRYLVLPNITNEICKLKYYENLINSKTANLKGKERDAVFDKLQTQYAEFVASLNEKDAWAKILYLSEWDRLDKDTRRYLSVLQR